MSCGGLCFHHGFNLDPRLLACKAAVVSRLQDSADHKEVAAFDISLVLLSANHMPAGATPQPFDLCAAGTQSCFHPQAETMDHLQIYRAFPSGLTRQWTHRDL